MDELSSSIDINSTVKHKATEIVQELSDLIDDQLNYIEEHLIHMEEEGLQWRPSKYKWNILEVLEHLIRFGEFYIPKFRHIIAYPRALKNTEAYRSGAIGRWAIKQVRPVDGVVVNKAKSPSKANPFLRKLTRSVIHEYIEQQKVLLELLQNLEGVDLSKNHVPTIVTNWFKLNLGDSLRLVVHHEERHFIQINDLVHKKLDT